MITDSFTLTLFNYGDFASMEPQLVGTCRLKFYRGHIKVVTYNVCEGFLDILQRSSYNGLRLGGVKAVHVNVQQRVRQAATPNCLNREPRRSSGSISRHADWVRVREGYFHTRSSLPEGSVILYPV